MGEDKHDKLARAYVMLSALRKNIDQMTSVTETYVTQFHTVLDRLEAIKIDVSDFRIPDLVVKPKVTGVPAVNYLTGESRGHVSYSKEKYVDKSFILTKLDAIIGYLKNITSEKPRRIGFSK